MRGVAAALLLAAVAVTANDCPSDWSQEKLLVHEDCNKFYMCTYGEPVERPCWGDLLFNVETGQCDWQANVDCGDRNIPGQEAMTTAVPETEPTTPELETEPTTAEPTTPEPTTAEPSTAELTTAEPTTAEPPTAEPTTAEATTPEPTTAEPTTTEPTTAEPTTAEPTTAEPTTAESTTAEPTTVEQTTAEPTTPELTTAEPTTAEPSTPQPGFLENGCPVDPHVHWLLPVEGDCNGFYYCVWGELVLGACPPTLYFNRVLQVCDYPANAGCTTSLNKHSTQHWPILSTLLDVPAA